MQATDACPSKDVGWYKKNNVPALCNKHAGSAIDSPKVEAEKKKQEEEKLKQEAEQNQNGENAGDVASNAQPAE